MSTYKKQFHHMLNTFGTHLYNVVLDGEAAGNLECYVPEPIFHFSLFLPILFCALGHLFPTHSLTRRLDRHQIT